ncbi:MAG TPA: iron-sulfur cluster-binding protein, partial [Lachnospiraceae bacterium]|nr:iron-sulfur cluster-binding protein [Lachnospiraceae bacterium]
MNANQILKIYGTDYLEMTVRLLEEADLAAQIPGREACIGIKPNLVVPSPADFGATTHPEIVEGIIEYLHANGFGNILIA